MTGFQKSAQQAILQSPTVGLKRTLYVSLFHWTGTAGDGAGVEPADDNSSVNFLSEVVSNGGPSNGYSRLTLAATDWPVNATAGQLGSPTTMQAPSLFAEVPGLTSLTWTATGTVTGASSGFGEVCAWGLWTSSTFGTLVCAGPLTDATGVPVSRQINTGDSFQFTTNFPIIVRMGDPAPSGTYASRTLPV